MARTRQILLIEDDKDYAEAMLASLCAENTDLQICVAADVFEALNYMADIAFDLVVVDWRLHDMTGGSLFRMLDNYLKIDQVASQKWVDRRRMIPIMILSASQREDIILPASERYLVIDVLDKRRGLSDIVDHVESTLTCLERQSPTMRAV